MGSSKPLGQLNLLGSRRLSGPRRIRRSSRHSSRRPGKDPMLLLGYLWIFDVCWVPFELWSNFEKGDYSWDLCGILIEGALVRTASAQRLWVALTPLLPVDPPGKPDVGVSKNWSFQKLGSPVLEMFS